MPLPRKQIFTLAEISKRWGVAVHDLGCYAIEDVLVLSTVVNGIDAEVGEYVVGGDGETFRASHGSRRLAGVHHLYGYDVWPVFKGEKAVIRQFRPEEPDAFIDVEDPAGGIEIGLADLVVTRAERDRFEAEHGLNGTAAASRVGAPHTSPRGGPGAPPRHDWDGFWIAVCRHIHDSGLPETQAALVRSLMDWLSTNTDSVPDESTVRKKVSRLWRSGMGA
ncbi:MAG: hypothetical protein HQL34_13960 [Alphaproteobacteria bacterium]|nr:hypothetical protein [Alphaproteobacteria bacterium]